MSRGGLEETDDDFMTRLVCGPKKNLPIPPYVLKTFLKHSLKIFTGFQKCPQIFLSVFSTASLLTPCKT